MVKEKWYIAHCRRYLFLYRDFFSTNLMSFKSFYRCNQKKVPIITYVCTERIFYSQYLKYKFTHLLEFDLKNCLNWKFVGHFPPNQTVGAKNVPTLRDPIMSRYYHVKLVSELKNRFLQAVGAIVSLLLSTCLWETNFIILISQKSQIQFLFEKCLAF